MDSIRMAWGIGLWLLGMGLLIFGVGGAFSWIIMYAAIGGTFVGAGATHILSALE